MSPDFASGLFVGLLLGILVTLPASWFSIPLVVHEVRKWHRGPS